jgi:hypothetical protein
MPPWRVDAKEPAQAQLREMPFADALLVAKKVYRIAAAEDCDYLRITDEPTRSRFTVKNYRGKLVFDHVARVVTILYVVRVDR